MEAVKRERGIMSCVFDLGMGSTEEKRAARQQMRQFVINPRIHVRREGESSTLLAAAASPSLSLSAEAEEGEFDIEDIMVLYSNIQIPSIFADVVTSFNLEMVLQRL